MSEICDPCGNAVEDEAEQPLDAQSKLTVAMEMGADIADHLCEKVTDNGRSCDCACSASWARRVRAQ